MTGNILLLLLFMGAYIGLVLTAYEVFSTCRMGTLLGACVLVIVASILLFPVVCIIGG